MRCMTLTGKWCGLILAFVLVGTLAVLALVAMISALDVVLSFFGVGVL